MKIACSTSAFKTDLETALRTIAEAEFKYVDLIGIGAWDHVNVPQLAADFETEANRVERLLMETALTPIGMNCAVSPHLRERGDAAQNESRRKEIRAIARLIKHLEIPLASFYPGFYDEQYWEYEPVFRATVDTIKEILEIAQDEGVTFLIEPHVKTPFDTVARTRRLLETIPELNVAYDPTHFVHDGSNLEETRFIISRARHAHIRDANREKIHAPLGAGDVDVGEFIRLLRKERYQGNISIELLPGGEKDPTAEAVQLRQLLDEHIS